MIQANTKTPNEASSRSFDYSPLSLKIGLSQFRSIIKNNLANNALYIFMAFVLIGVFLFSLAGVILIIIFTAKSDAGSILYGLGFVSIFIGSSLLFVYSYLRKLVAVYKMSQFAQANNIGFIAHQNTISHIGMIFNEGHSRVINYAYIFKDKYNSQVGSYSYTTGSGKSSKTHTYGYIVFDLPRNVPHMLLDAKSNNFMGLLSNLPASFSSDQKLALEGDFNNYFTLYAPKEYEKDALYIFTPDVMQAVVSMAKSYDIEIISNKLYLYSQKQFDLAEKSEIEQLLKIISILAGQFYEQTDYYADETIGNRALDTINIQGKRLKKSYLPIIVSIIIAIAFLYIWFNFAKLSSFSWFIPIFVVANIVIFISRLYKRK